MSFEFGIFHEFQRRAGQTDAEAFAESFAQVDAAERWGLDVLWLAELHFVPERSVLASPLTIASAIAARTKRMKIGIAVQVLPLCQPLRLAEEVATVDHISQGRLIFGVGRSGFPRTYEAYGVPYGESRERFAEVLEILRRAWTENRFSHEGQFYSYTNVQLVPKPLQQPHPPVRIAATSADTFASIGAQGFPIFVAVRLGTIEELGPNIRAYQEAYAAAGHPGRGKVYLRVPVYVAETAERARAEPEESMMHLSRTLGAQLEDSTRRAGVHDVENRAARGARLQNVTYEDALRDKLIVGTPDMVAERIADLRDKLGLDGILAEMNSGGRIPADLMMRSLQLLCERVVPHFR
jgi:alkanesulfonate monooxygenase SsuD/methylene tetrahydromethanopterin reductase-like flavin-dependent oxidoreductase (luciferase family)